MFFLKSKYFGTYYIREAIKVELSKTDARKAFKKPANVAEVCWSDTIFGKDF